MPGWRAGGEEGGREGMQGRQSRKAPHTAPHGSSPATRRQGTLKTDSIVDYKHETLTDFSGKSDSVTSTLCSLPSGSAHPAVHPSVNSGPELQHIFRESSQNLWSGFRS